MSAGTAAALITGRFAFLPFQRRTQDKSQAVGPKTTGEMAVWLTKHPILSDARAAGPDVGVCCMRKLQRANDSSIQATITAKLPSAHPNAAGTTYFDALQQDASFITTTNDPAGFTLIDTLAWGALGRESFSGARGGASLLGRANGSRCSARAHAHAPSSLRLAHSAQSIAPRRRGLCVPRRGIGRQHPRRVVLSGPTLPLKTNGALLRSGARAAADACAAHASRPCSV